MGNSLKNEIIKLRLEGKTYDQIKELLNCSKSTISAIKNKRNWKYLTKDINFD